MNWFKYDSRKDTVIIKAREGDYVIEIGVLDGSVAYKLSIDKMVGVTYLTLQSAVEHAEYHYKKCLVVQARWNQANKELDEFLANQG